MTRLALVAADWALADAGVDPADLPDFDMGVVTASSVGRLRVRPARAAEAVEQGRPVRQRLPVLRLVLRREHRPDLHPARHARPQRRRRQRPGRRPGRGRRRPAGRSARAPGWSSPAASTPRSCPWGWVAQLASGRLSTGDDPTARLPALRRARPRGHVPGEGGAILVLEDADGRPRRAAPRSYGEIAGYARHLRPAARQRPAARRCASAIELALADAGADARRHRRGLRRRRRRCPSSTGPRPRRSPRSSAPHGVPVTAPKTMTGRLLLRRGPARPGDRAALHPRRRDPADRRHVDAGRRLPPRPGHRRSRAPATGAHRAGARPRPRRLQLRHGRAPERLVNAGRAPTDTAQTSPSEKVARMPSKVMAKGPAKKSDNVQHCDVVILGSGLAGSITGAILARQGAKVVLIDAGQHPRFAVGESMTPAARRVAAHPGRALRRTGDQAPAGREGGHRAHRPAPRQEAELRLRQAPRGPGAGPARGDDVRHPEDAHRGQPPVPAGHATRTTSTSPPSTAARIRQNWFATDLDFDDDGVTVTGQNGEVFRAKYLIDASGFRSPLAREVRPAREPAAASSTTPGRCSRTTSASSRTTTCATTRGACGRPPQWHGGTLHHLIERGWFWIIPFDNYKDSRTRCAASA